jgi:hypothetical protein
MDETRFDHLVRTFAMAPTRRGILTALARTATGATVAALAAVPRNEEAAASCRELFAECTRTRQCCGHKKKKRVCAINEHDGPTTQTTCCIPEGKRCDFGGQCCGTLGCVGTSPNGRCGVSIVTVP